MTNRDKQLYVKGANGTFLICFVEPCEKGNKDSKLVNVSVTELLERIEYIHKGKGEEILLDKMAPILRRQKKSKKAEQMVMMPCFGFEAVPS